MEKHKQFVIIACDPDEGVWSIVLQTDSADEALDFWNDMPGDTSLRIAIDTSRFITFDLAKAVQS